jgi:subtilisin family serine protease
MVKLKTPSLLSTAQHDGSNAIVVDPQQKEKLLKEQDEFEKYIKGLSREITILHRYRFVLNGYSLLVPKALADKISSYKSMMEMHASQSFSRPASVTKKTRTTFKVGTETSVKFIGADRVQKELKLDGKGIRVGVIDTGVDYTHKMFGGEGTEEAYTKARDDFKSNLFPTSKVVGGVDLVGSDYDDTSSELRKRIPMRGPNPLDESGHGSHVAGTIAGVGDGENTYSGVAPGASLYAIKVFGKEGSTSDAVVIAALEYAVNPSGNLDPNDHLDVVNLSLGSPFGVPYRLYDEAIKNLVKADVIPVISAGNSGNVPFIVGSPSSSDETISVASSIDNMDQNWKFKAVRFQIGSESVISKAVEASFTKPIDSVGDLQGTLAYIGLANQDLSDEQKALVRGNVALIDRGGSPFAEKITRAVGAGAIGVVVANNADGEVLSMGGKGGPFDVPALMIRKDLGQRIKETLARKEVASIVFSIPEKIEDASLIDTLSAFSSRGPRSLDSGIKPEISAPGSNIISAQVGGGAKSVAMSGTSMAAPHMSGCVALVKQKYPRWNASKIKSALMAHTVTIKDATGLEYPVSRQGAGRIDIYKTLNESVLTSTPSSIALGELEIVQTKELRKSLVLENQTDQVMNVYIRSSVPEGLRFEFPTRITIPSQSHVEIAYPVTIDAPSDTQMKELSGFLYVVNDDNGVELAKLPVLAEVRRLSLLQTEGLRVRASQREDAESAPAELRLQNRGPHAGQALIFNLIAKNQRKKPIGPQQRFSDICDLESVAYRTIERVENENKVKILQFAAKLYSPMTNWELCELSIQIDGNGDGKTDQEIIGGSLYTLNPSVAPNAYKTILTDADKMRSLRSKVDGGAQADYSEAILDLQDLTTYDHGTLMILNIPLSKLQVQDYGLLKVKIASLASAEPLSSPDDFLGTNANTWWSIDPFELASSYYGMPEIVEVPAHSSFSIPMTHGEGLGDMIVYYPFNRSSRTASQDLQSEVVKEEFVYW